MKKTENEAMMWTTSRVEKVLDGIDKLHKKNDADCVLQLQKENEKLRNEMLEIQKTHKKAINDICMKGNKMEQLMRQLLDERSRLIEELSQLRKYKGEQVKETDSKTTMTISFPRKDAIVQVNLQQNDEIHKYEQSTQTLNDSDILISPKCSKNNFGEVSQKSSTLYPDLILKPLVDNRVAANSIYCKKGSETLALAIYASGVSIENLKLHVYATDWVFVGINMNGWWNWQSQTQEELNKVSKIVQGFGSDSCPLLWCAALASALIKLDSYCTMTLGDLLVSACGYYLRPNISLTSTSLTQLIELLELGSGCFFIVLQRRLQFHDDVALVSAVSHIRDKVVFYVVRAVSDVEYDTNDDGRNSNYKLIGEWQSSEQLLDQFDVFQTVECFSAEKYSEIRWIDTVKNHYVSVQIVLHSELPKVEEVVHARLLDVINSSWYSLKIILQNEKTFTLYCPLLECVESAVLVLNIDLNIVRRLDFLQVSRDDGLFAEKEHTMIVQVNGQEMYTSHVVLNLVLEQVALQMEEEEKQNNENNNNKNNDSKKKNEEKEKEEDVHQGLHNIGIDRTISSEHGSNLVNTTDDDYGYSIDNLVETHSYQRDDSSCMETFLFLFHSLFMSRMDLMMDYVDTVESILVSSYLSPSTSDKTLINHSLLPVLHANMVRQGMNICALKSRNNFISTSLSTVASELDTVRENLTLALNESDALRIELMQSLLELDQLRQDSKDKDIIIEEVKLHCCELEQRLCGATRDFTELHYAFEHMQEEHHLELLKKTLLLRATQEEMERLKSHGRNSSSSPSLHPGDGLSW